MIDRSMLAPGREPVLAVLEAAVAAVDPRRAVAAAVSVDAASIRFGGLEVAHPKGRVITLGLGKAAVAMAWGLADAGLEPHGLVATPVPGRAPPGVYVAAGGHPIPDASSMAAGERLMASAREAGPDDLIVVLVSGGGSACAEVPAPGAGPEVIEAATWRLLAAGAPITEVNAIRRRLSALKGGGLAAAAHPARVATLVLSDVVGNHLPTIAGGPTVPDPGSLEEAAGAARRWGLAPDAVEAVEATPDGPMIEPGPVVIVGDGTAAAAGAIAAAGALGIEALLGEVGLTGEAREVGTRLADRALAASAPGMVVHAGETTVTVAGNGSGGRNQELALAAAVNLDGTEGAVVASMGTDGIDGPTEAAGGIADGGTLGRGRAAGLEAEEALSRNDSGPYLAATRDRIVTGSTGTNVGDVMVVYRAG